MAHRSGLGRGLGALIPTDVLRDRGALAEIAVSAIQPNPRQPRGHFDEEPMAALAASIREVGVLQPVLVRRLSDHEYELIAGERRWRAARRAGLATVPAIIRTASESESLEQALIENLNRAELSPLEEAAGYQQLIEDFELTHEQLSARVGKSRAAITNALRLFQLPPSVQRLLGEGRLSAGHARALLGTPDRAFQEALARRAANEQLSVRAVEDAVRQHNEALDAAGQDPGPPKTAGRLRPPGVLELEELLTDYLSTKVRVDMGANRGKVVIEFASLEDLERIYRVMTEPEQ
ncbi:MAG TPA: ParB/RepB/Spo0J family partition protein [Acidimicrobiales bacterium]|nr:ParB/RepB/Spo0J family partition protein [Acidimicrobiales bacterium]HUB69231.1 ParB/RepB/Spo0J family partition protein [Acidimicrobiales bacterium]